MRPGYTYQSAEWDSEILRSGDFQLISVTLDSTAKYRTGTYSGGATKIPKGCILTKQISVLTDGTYIPASTEANYLASTATQYMLDAVVLAETILDASLGDQQVKVYFSGTFKLAALKYVNSANAVLTAAQVAECQRLRIVDGPTS
jgi:hypothetical protein